MAENSKYVKRQTMESLLPLFFSLPPLQLLPSSTGNHQYQLSVYSPRYVFKCTFKQKLEFILFSPFVFCAYIPSFFLNLTLCRRPTLFKLLWLYNMFYYLMRQNLPHCFLNFPHHSYTFICSVKFWNLFYKLKKKNCLIII